MERDASVGVCLQCHAVKDALAGDHLPGRRLTDHYSLLSPQLGESPHYADQVPLFVHHKLKPTHLDEEDLMANLSESYRPGEREE